MHAPVTYTSRSCLNDVKPLTVSKYGVQCGNDKVAYLHTVYVLGILRTL